MPRFEDRHGLFWEVEQIELTVWQCRNATRSAWQQDPAAPPQTSSKAYATEDEARYAIGKLVARLLRRGFRFAGATRRLELPAEAAAARAEAQEAGDGGAVRLPAAPSALALEEHFAAGDDRFLGEVLASEATAKLAALAERWASDARPWARRMLHAYVDDGCDRPYHKPLVKRLFKRAEAAGDDELMARFLVAFDRLSRRALVPLVKRSWSSGSWTSTTRIALLQDPGVPGRLVVPGGGAPRESAQFSRATRRYLARRAARYFRQLGHRELPRYRRAMVLALSRYRDRALSSPARLLDAWGLMHALYAYAPVLVRTPRGLRLAEGRSLGELAPAPQVLAAWAGEGLGAANAEGEDAEGAEGAAGTAGTAGAAGESAEARVAAAFAALLELVQTARSRTVRQWARAMLRLHHDGALAQLGYAELKPLLYGAGTRTIAATGTVVVDRSAGGSAGGENEEALQLGLELLQRLRGLELLPVSEWLELLGHPNLDALAQVARLAERVLSPARLTLMQALALAGARAAPVAALGLAWARAKPVTTADELHAVLRLVAGGVAAVRDAGARWAIELLAGHPLATLEHVRDLCDAGHPDVRAVALAAIAPPPPPSSSRPSSRSSGGGSPDAADAADDARGGALHARFAAAPALWFALTESPYDDVRAFLLEQAAHWRAAAAAGSLRHLWTSALLAVHRGSAAKARALRQLSERLADHADEAAELLPVIGLALRSVRPAERALALGALARAMRGDREVHELAARLLPELTMGSQVVR